MKRFYLLFAVLLPFVGFGQSADIFQRINERMQTYKVDTSAVPDDKLTRKIKELRSLKGGFNIHEAMEYKIAESLQKKEMSETEAQKLRTFLTQGDGFKWIENATIRIYRSHFSYKEMKQLVRFYKTDAGRKMATDFPFIIFQSLKSAEFVVERFRNENK